MFHIVYKIINKSNNKIYVGIHSTKNINDDYMGSGTVLKRAIKKYGIKNFTKEILFMYDNLECALSKEKEIVNENFLKRTDVYNINIGGSGGFYHLNYGKNKHKNPVYTNEHQRKYSIFINQKDLTSEQREKILCGAKKGGKMAMIKLQRLNDDRHKFNENYYKDLSKNGRMTALNPNAKIKRKKTFKLIEHQKGTKNSQYGTMWITNEIINKKILKEDSIPEGWIKGRKIK